MSIALNELNTLSLENRWTYVDLITVYELVHNLLSFCMNDVGIEVIESNTRAHGYRLKQQLIVNRGLGQLFSYRISHVYNKLPQ